jgi:hypothetical protein
MNDENIYPQQTHADINYGQPPVNPFKDVLEMIRASHAQAAKIVEAAKQQEELHKHNYRVTGGMYFAIRYCTKCGKSWRLPLRYDDFEEPPDAVWEPISEPVDLLSPVLPDYDD